MVMNLKKVEIMRDDSYDFNYQEIISIKDYVTIKAGDSLRVHCVYNSMGRNTTTNFGISTYNEMCFALLLYYPKIPNYSFCLSFDKDERPNFRDGRATAICGSNALMDTKDSKLLPDCNDNDLSAFKTLLLNTISACVGDNNCTTTTCNNAITDVVNHNCVYRYGFKSLLSWYKTSVNITRILGIQSTCGVCTTEYSDSQCVPGNTCISNKCSIKSISHQGVQIAAVVILFIAIIIIAGIIGYKNYDKIKDFVNTKILNRQTSGYSSQLLVDEQDENF